VIVDAHLHTSGREAAGEVLRTLDDAGVELAVLLAPFLDGSKTRFHNPAALRAGNEHVGNLVRGHEDRLIGFAVVNPARPSALDDLDEAVQRYGLRGLKLVPSGWYPFDDCAHRIYERAAGLDIPILFHSGIFIDGRSGRFCQPVFYEAVRDHPSLRVTLAHLGWPWTDEANAVGLIDRINGVNPKESQFRFDISFGPPPIYRRQVLERALEVLGPDLLQFGSDRFLPCSGQHIKDALDEVERLMDDLGVGSTDRQKVMSGTAAAWLRIEPTRVA
jgi:hypothetical protein